MLRHRVGSRSRTMNRQAYFLEAERLSDDFAARAKAVDDYMKTAPDLTDDEA